MLQFATPISNGLVNPCTVPVSGGTYGFGFSGIPAVGAGPYINCAVPTGLPLWNATIGYTPVNPVNTVNTINPINAHVETITSSKKGGKNQASTAAINGAASCTPVVGNALPYVQAGVFNPAFQAGTFPVCAQPVFGTINPWWNQSNSYNTYGLNTLNTLGAMGWNNMAGSTGISPMSSQCLSTIGYNPITGQPIVCPTPVINQFGNTTVGCNPITGQPIVCPTPVSSVNSGIFGSATFGNAITNPFAVTNASLCGTPYTSQFCNTTVSCHPITGQPIACSTPSSFVPGFTGQVNPFGGFASPWNCSTPFNVVPQMYPINTLYQGTSVPVVSPVNCVSPFGYTPVNPVTYVIDPSQVNGSEAIMGLQREAA
jgi:hypothetical protein